MEVLDQLTLREAALLISFLVFGWPITKFVKYKIIEGLFNKEGKVKEEYGEDEVKEYLFRKMK